MRTNDWNLQFITQGVKDNKEDKKDQKVNDRKKQTPFLFYHSFYCQCVCLECAGGTHCYICILMTPPVGPEAGPSALPRDQLGHLLCPIINPYQLSLSLSLPSFSHVSFNCTSTFSLLRLVYPSLHTHTQKDRHVHFLLYKPIPDHIMKKQTHILLIIHTKSTFMYAYTNTDT